MNSRGKVGLAMAMFAGVSSMGMAQSAVDGAIGGTVEDATGAIVSGASVVIQNTGTNASQTVVTDASGYFRVIRLQPGFYSMRVTANGFSSYEATRVEVTVGSLTSVEPRLGAAGAAETVNVSSETPAINTTNNDFSNTIDLKVLEDVPVNNYRWSSYALLTPGVVESGGFGLLSFRGQSTLLNNVQFDGEDDNQAFFSEERGRTRVGYSTAKSSILEFQVNTSNYSVEYGRSAGGVVNAVTRSGTNQFHGEAYFFDRDAEWGAQAPFTYRAVQVSASPLTFANQKFKPKDWRKQYGVGIGGPIVKDKLFFFFAFDRFNRNFPGVSIPTSASTFYAAPPAIPTGTNGRCTGTTTATVDGAVCQLAANLNKSTLAATTQAQYTAALNTYTNDIGNLNNILGIAPRTGDQYIYFPKIDWQVNGKNHVTAELNRLRWTSPAGIQTSSTVNYGTSSYGNDFVKSTFGIAKLDTLITSTLSNEIRYQYGRDFEYEFNQTPTSYENSTLDNVTTGPSAGYRNPFQIPPSVNITNAFQFGTATFLNRPAYPDERRWEVSDTFNQVRGNHNLKFGVEYLHTNDLSQNLTTVFGGYTYGGSNFAPYVAYFTDLAVQNGCGAGSAVNSATHTQECYTTYAQGFGPLGFEFQTGDYAGFVQDEWKVVPRLSLTLGLRYEYEQTPKPQIPNTTTPTSARGSTSVFPDNRTNIGPRVGFAWDVFGNGKTSVRGGYGEFFARLQNSTIYNALAQTGNPAGQLQVSLTGSPATAAVNGGTPLLFPRVVNPQANPTGSGAVNVIYFDRNFKMPEIHQADLTVEQDLGWSSTLSLSWLAAFGRRLPDFVDTNLFPSTTTVSYNVLAGGPVPTGTVIKMPYYSGQFINGAYQSRPNAAYGATTDIFSGVNSNYEGFVAQFSHRLTHGLQINANYTWSHALDYGENNTTFSNTNSLFDPFNVRSEYGNSNQNIPNRIVAYAIYNTPSKYRGLLGYLLNNYEISPSVSAQNGAPYTGGVTGTFNNVVLDNGQRVVSSGAVSGVSVQPGSTSAGINGSGGTARLPNLERNVFFFRREMLADVRISKRFRIFDRVDAELLAESFNIANHLNQTGVGSTSAYGYTAGAVTNGVVTTGNTLTSNAAFGVFNPSTFTGNANNNFIYTPRQVQLGARVQF